MNNNRDRPSELRTNRRKFVQALSAGTGAITLASTGGFVGASSTPDDVNEDDLIAAGREYASPAQIITTFQEQGEELIQSLQQKGVIGDQDIENIVSENIVSPINLGEEDYATSVAGTIHEGTPTAHLMSKYSNSGYKIELIIQPQVDRRYAIVHPKEEDGQTFVVDPSLDEVN